MIEWLFIALAIVIVGLLIYTFWTNTPTYKGEEGEKRVHGILLNLPDEYTVFKDVVLPTEKGTTQIDHIVVSRYGVFAIETKNYRGLIYGDDKRKYWTQNILTDVVYGRKWYKTYTYSKKSQFYNPVKQSLTHSFAIKKYLSDWPYLKIVPIVVFAGDATIANVTSSYHVIYDFDLLTTIQSYKTSYLSDSDVQKVVRILEENDMRSIVDNRAHIQNLRTRAYDVNNMIASRVCPKCGSNLVLREGKYGNFYGCSNYPKCKFTTNL